MQSAWHIGNIEIFAIIILKNFVSKYKNICKNSSRSFIKLFFPIHFPWVSVCQPQNLSYKIT